MISEKYIMQLVKQYANSPQGKAEILKKYGVHYVENISKNDLITYGNQMKQILFEHINKVIKSIKLEDIVVEEPIIDKDGKATLKISFKEGSLHRDSLYENGYPEGISNIVLLFAHGYHASDYVYGLWDLPNQTWYGGNGFVGVRSRRDREPDDFLYAAVTEFNKQTNGFAIAKLEDKYK